MTPITDNATLSAMMSDQGIPDRVTAEQVKSRIVDTMFTQVPGTTTTICAITLANGFVVTGTSACVEPTNFNAILGTDLAYENAVSKIWELEAYLLCEERNRIKQAFIQDELEAQEKYLAEAGQGIAAAVAAFVSEAGLSDIKVTLNVAGLDEESQANGEVGAARAT